MAITLTSMNGMPNSTRQACFIIDSDADVVDLPTTTEKGTFGKTVDEMSTAVTHDGRIFVLGNDGQWHEW